MTDLRTKDVSYGADYWNSLDGGGGYGDSVFWEDIACAIRETFGYSWPDKEEDITPGKMVLDLGCAMGYLIRHLRRRGLETFGCDVSDYAIANAPKDVRRNISKYDLTGDYPPIQPYMDFTWDIVVCLEVMEHIEEGYVDKALDNIKKSMVPGGLAVFSICTSEQPDPYSDPTHVCIKPSAWWYEKFKDAGFTHVPGRVESLRSWRFFTNHPGVFVVRSPK